MILIKRENWEIGIVRTSHRYWKLETCGVMDNFHKIENGTDFKFINARSYYMNTCIEIFWLKFKFYVLIKPKLISGNIPQRYVKFEDTHLDLLDIPHGNWND